MENNLLLVIFGGAISLIFAYAPKLKDWYEALTSPQKSLVMVVALALTAGAVYLAACYTPWQAVECSEAGAQQLVEMFVAALVGSQLSYLTAVRPVKKDKPSDVPVFIDVN